MTIPEWMNKWIEQLDDPITDTVINIPDIGDIHAGDYVYNIYETYIDIRIHTGNLPPIDPNCQNTFEEIE